MSKTTSSWICSLIPVCLICFLYLCAFDLFVCATNSLIYSTVCLLHANQSFCSDIDQNKTLRELQQDIQKEASEWSLYGTLSFALIACFISPIFGSLSDMKNRKYPIILTISNAILTGLIITIGSVFQGDRISLYLYLLANIVNGFGGGSLILISSCFGYATDRCTDKNQHVQTIAFIESSLNIGMIIGYMICTFIFEVHGKIWIILLTHLLLLFIALFISLAFLRSRPKTDRENISILIRIRRSFLDIRDLIVDLKDNSLLISFIILLLSLGFYEIYRMGSSSVFYLYLHAKSFDDTEYATYFTYEQLGTFGSLVLLAFIQRKWKINDIYICFIGLSLSSVGLGLFAFAKDKTMIFSAAASMMFSLYFPVCLRAIIIRLVPEKDKGKALSFVALIQTFDLLIGTIACVQIYNATMEYFLGFIFLFALGMRFIALILLLIQVCCVSSNPQLSLVVSDEERLVN